MRTTGSGVDLGWIWTGNLRPFLVELGRLTGYGFDDSDWIAVEYGIHAPTARPARGSPTPSAASG